MKKYLESLPMPEGMSREEICELLLREEYGYLPAAPVAVRAEEESVDEKFYAGKAVLKKIRLICDTGHGEFGFPIYYTCPLKLQRPMPCFIQINFRDQVPDKYQPTEELVDEGFAVISFCYKDVTSDDGDFTDGLAGVVYPDGKRTPTQCGKIGLWAWAAMRVMDYALTLPELDSHNISVVGHSRLGKTALLTGALDERFFCAISNDSGCSGAAISRGKRGETIRKIYDKFPFWFCENFEKYADNEENMPFDQHFLLAANSSHRVYVASASEDIWADPMSEYLSCAAASEYFENQGLTGFVHPDRFPTVGECFHEGHIGYHLREGKHYLGREDWKYYIKYLRQYMN